MPAPASGMGPLRSACCRAPLECTVQLSTRIPAHLYRRVTKASLRSAEVTIEAAAWERAMWSCTQCHRVWRPGEFPDYHDPHQKEAP